MAYRLQQNNQELVLLEISTKVACFENTRFSNMNATDNNMLCGETINSLQSVNFVAVKKTFVKKEDPDFKAHQAEVLVKTWIPLKYIININHPTPMPIHTNVVCKL